MTVPFLQSILLIDKCFVVTHMLSAFLCSEVVERRTLRSQKCHPFSLSFITKREIQDMNIYVYICLPKTDTLHKNYMYIYVYICLPKTDTLHKNSYLDHSRASELWIYSQCGMAPTHEII